MSDLPNAPKPKRVRVKAQPNTTRIYAYGADVRKEHRQTAMDILFKANQYSNKLIEIERARRTTVEGVLAAHSPELAGVEAALATCNATLDAWDTAIANEMGSREYPKGKGPVVTELRPQIKAMKATRRAVYAQRKSIRDGLFTNPAVRALFEESDSVTAAAVKTARAACGIHFGTYLCVEDSRRADRKGAPPEFNRFDHSGRIAVQVQKGNKLKYHLQIDPPDNVNQKWCNARIRIGTLDRATPVWLPFRVSMHRPLPPQAVIKWAWLHAERIGTHTKWSLQITLSQDNWAKEDNAITGVVGVDVGWRLLDTGDIRAGSWCGDDGRHGEIVIPAERIERWRYVNVLQGIRDSNFNELLPRVIEGLKSLQLPEWLAEATKTIAMWKHCGRLAGVAVKWRSNRFDGDTALFDIVEAWRKQDRHLYDWQSQQRRGEERWRQDFYRNTAAFLARQYRTAVIETTEWCDFWENPPKEDDIGVHDLHRRCQSIAAVSYLNDALRKRFSVVLKVPAEYTTLRCHSCGEICDFDAERSLSHTCEHCGVRWDQDYNAAVNLLHSASGPAVVNV